MESFDIYFLGEKLPDADPTTVRHGVAKLFKVQESAVDRLFSGKPLRVKQGVDAEAAGRYRTAFRDVGALVQIVASGSSPPAPKAPDERAARTAGATAEARPMADEAPPRPPADSGGYGLAEPGAILDHSEAPAPAEIDTGSLEALPPNTGSLEDCQVEKPHRPIPDISHLRLVDD